MRGVLLALVCSGSLLAAGCGGDESPAVEETTAASAAQPTTVALSSTPSSTAPSSTAPPDRPEAGALEPGVEYTIGDTIGDLRFAFRSPDTGSLSLEYGPNLFGLYRADQPETVTAMLVIDTGRLNIADIDPPSGAPIGRSELPGDVLRWIQDRPFLETLEPPRPVSVGDAAGTMMVTRTTALPTATDASYCAMTSGDPPADPPASVEGCAALFVDDQGGPWTTFPGTVTEFALLRLGSSEVLILTERLAGDTQPTLLDHLRVTEST